MELAHDGGDDARQWIREVIAGLSDAMAPADELAAGLGQAVNPAEGLTMAAAHTVTELGYLLVRCGSQAHHGHLRQQAARSATGHPHSTEIMTNGTNLP